MSEPFVTARRAGGPLAGLRVLELASRGPGTVAAMILGDLGAEVVRIERPGSEGEGDDRASADYTLRSRQIVTADLKLAADLSRVVDLVAGADVFIEGFLPGVAERMGIGPDECSSRNPALVYARMTGWGQDGSYASTAGHDINYISVTGVLENIGRAGERPVPPLNLVGNYGGGAMFLVTGILAALLERSRSGKGQVVDAAMSEGASVLATLYWSARGAGHWHEGRGGNLIDGSKPFYDTYLCADGRSMAVGCVEPQFFALAVELLGLDPAELPDQHDEERAGQLREAFATAFRTKTMAEWTEIFAGTNACVTPVLTYTEALTYPQFVDREVFTRIGGVEQPRPAPRFSRTPSPEPTAPRRVENATWSATR